MTALHNGHCRLDDNDNDYLRASDLTLGRALGRREGMRPGSSASGG